jgi:uncharacterized protein YecT (DUF1311 family)
LWGPDGSTLEAEAGDVAQERAQAEKAMGKVLHAIEARAEDSQEAAGLVRDQSAFAGARDDACRDYVKESVYGYCATRLTEARTALLEERLEALPPTTAAKPAKSKAAKKKKTPKTGAAVQ